jgi:hypothetical protein
MSRVIWCLIYVMKTKGPGYFRTKAAGFNTISIIT